MNYELFLLPLHRNPKGGYRIGLWCNGSTRHFGRLSSGSKPDSPTIKKALKVIFQCFFCFFSTILSYFAL